MMIAGMVHTWTGQELTTWTEETEVKLLTEWVWPAWITMTEDMVTMLHEPFLWQTVTCMVLEHTEKVTAVVMVI